jgi:hypothetical protein
MTVTKTARQKMKNNTRYYGYTLTQHRDVLDPVPSPKGTCQHNCDSSLMVGGCHE